MTLQVRLVQACDTGKIYAMKTLRKSEMMKKDQVSQWLVGSMTSEDNNIH